MQGGCSRSNSLTSGQEEKKIDEDCTGESSRALSSDLSGESAAFLPLGCKGKDHRAQAAMSDSGALHRCETYILMPAQSASDCYYIQQCNSKCTLSRLHVTQDMVQAVLLCKRLHLRYMKFACCGAGWLQLVASWLGVRISTQPGVQLVTCLALSNLQELLPMSSTKQHHLVS